jgi:RHS repeat-associated protein
MYEHGGGIDAPLGVVRMEYSSELHDPQVIVPLSDWRGTYDRGTTTVGNCLLYTSNGKQLAPPPDSTPSTADQYGGVVGGGTYNGTKEHCIDVDWPGAYTWSALQYRRGYSGPDSWMGSLVFESRDASGLYYRRNRYYDSEKGRFTQEDPIGLAGGINVYGFAAGDPVAYSDPYGLCPWWMGTGAICEVWDAYQEHGIRGVADLGVSASPLSDVNDGITTVMGRNLITGERVSGGDRIVIGLSAVIPFVASRTLRNLVGDLYKGARYANPIGTGSTADAIRHETATALQVHGTWHLQKGLEYLVGLQKWLRNNPNASDRDIMVARSIADDLQQAVNEALQAGRKK